MSDAPVELVLSTASFAITCYFWFVQARREKAQLHIYQIGNFKAVCRRHPQQQDLRRLCVQQLDNAGVLIANNSSRQNSIVLFECTFIPPVGNRFRGDWGTVGDDRPPWNIGPDTTIGMGLACFFDVPSDFEVPDGFVIEVDFVTANGDRFRHVFFEEAPIFGEQQALSQ